MTAQHKPGPVKKAQGVTENIFNVQIRISLLIAMAIRMYFAEVNTQGLTAKNGKKIVNEIFDELRYAKLNPVQELLLLEVALRIIHADEKIDENELKLLKFLRGKLAVFDYAFANKGAWQNIPMPHRCPWWTPGGMQKLWHHAIQLQQLW